MTCEKCGGQNLYIIESRPGYRGIGSRRRRECADCGQRITTYEVTKKEYDMVLKCQKLLEKAQKIFGDFEEGRAKAHGDETEYEG